MIVFRLLRVSVGIVVGMIIGGCLQFLVDPLNWWLPWVMLGLGYAMTWLVDSLTTKENSGF